MTIAWYQLQRYAW